MNLKIMILMCFVMLFIVSFLGFLVSISDKQIDLLDPYEIKLKNIPAFKDKCVKSKDRLTCHDGEYKYEYIEYYRMLEK